MSLANMHCVPVLPKATYFLTVKNAQRYNTLVPGLGACGSISGIQQASVSTYYAQYE